MSRASHICATVGCPAVIPRAGRCPDCKGNAERERGTAASRGYDSRWARRRLAYLKRHPICVRCGGIANVADHYPTSRRELLTLGVPDPDADHRLRPLCTPCHGTETARHQPGGWNSR